RLIVEETAMPALKAEAVAAWRGLLPALRDALAAKPCRQFESALDNAVTDWPTLEDEFGAITERLMSLDDDAALLAGQMIAIESRLRDGREKAWSDFKN